MTSPKPAEQKKYLIGALAVALVMCAVFWQVIAGKAYVSKEGLLAVHDQFFGARLLPGGVVYEHDPGSYLGVVILQYLAGLLWSSHSVPLWNPYSACGFPMVGDPQSLVLSPLPVLFPYTAPYLYNFSFFIKALISAVGSFAVAWRLGLPVPSCILAGLSYGLCPFILTDQPEGTIQEWLMPVIFLPFAALCRRPSLSAALLAGIVCGVCALSMNPEPLLCACVCAGLMFLASSLPSGTRDGGTKDRGFSRKAIILLAVAAIACILTAAPMVFPFFEFTNYWSNYKTPDTMHGISSMPGINVLLETPIIHRLALNLLMPLCREWSIYLGSGALLLLPLAFLHRDKRLKTVAIPWAIGLILIGPLAFLFRLTVIGLLAKQYLLGPIALLTAILSGVGLANVLNSTEIHRSKARLCIALTTFAGFICVPSIKAAKIPLSAIRLPPVAINAIPDSVWKLNLVCLALSAVLLIMLWRFRNPKTITVILIALIALNVGSQVPSLRYELKDRPAFSFEDKDPLPYLKARDQRVMAVGYEFFMANCNLPYQLRDLRFFNPVMLKRYVDFIEAAGAIPKIRSFDYRFPAHLSKLLDLASVKYVLANEPLEPEADEIAAMLNLPATIPNKLFSDYGLKLLSSNFYLDRQNKELFGDIRLKATKGQAARYCVQVALLQANGTMDRYSEPFCLEQTKDGSDFYSSRVRIGLEKENESQAKLLGMRVCDLWFARTYTLIADLEKDPKNYVPILSIDRSNLKGARQNPRRMELLLETKDRIRLYENRSAKPQAYLVHTPLFAQSEKESLAKLTSPSFDPVNQVVIETRRLQEESLSQQEQSSTAEFVKVSRPDNNSVVVDATANSEGWLVLTDSFYPGWHAKIDGSEVEIHPANVLFRAIKFPSGKHTVRFYFESNAFVSGLAAAFFVVLLWMALFLKERLRRFEGYPAQGEAAEANRDAKDQARAMIRH